ncbi:MAG: hypothetical protein GF329_04145 [Candidatus Lokiarchaeota archaeon]|nr:hypothetical protein [Candidatus Lokiarchaeota archaeon]
MTEEKKNMTQIIVESFMDRGIELSEAEARAFTVLYGKGYITRSSLSSLAGISVEEAENTINKFIENDLAIEIGEAAKDLTRYMPVVPYSAFTEFLDGYREKTIQQRKEFDANINKHINDLKEEVSTLKNEVAEAINTQLEQFATETINARDGISDLITNQVIKLNSDVETRKEEITNNFDKRNEDHNNLIHEYEETLSQDLDKRYNELMDKTKNIHDTAAENHKMELDDLNNRIDNTLDQYANKILDEVASENVEGLNLLNTRIDGVFDEFTDRIIVDYVNGVNSVINTNREQNYTAYDEWHSKLSEEFLEMIKQEIAATWEKDKELRNEIQTSQDNHMDWFKKRASHFRETAEKLFNNEITKRDREFYQFRDDVENFSNDLVLRFKKLVKDIQQEFLDRFSNQIKRLQDGSTDLEKTLTSNLDKRLGQLNSAIESSKTSLNEKMDASINELNGSLDKLKADVKSSLKNLKSEEKGKVKDITKKVSDQIKNKITEIKNLSSDKISGTISSIKDWEKDLESKLKDVGKDNPEIKEIIDTALKTLNNKIKEEKNIHETLDTNINESLKDLSKGLETEINEYQDEINTSVDEWLNKTNVNLEEIINSQTLEINSKKENAIKNFNIILRNNYSWFDENASKFGDQTKTVINSQVEEIELDFYKLKDSIVSKSDEVIKRYSDLINEQKDKFIGKISGQNELLQKDTSKLEKVLSDTLDDRIKEYQGELDSMRDEFYQALDLRVGNVESQSHEIRNKSIDLLANIIHEHKNNLKDIDDKKLKELDDITETMHQSTDEKKDDVANIVQTEIKRVDDVKVAGHNALDEKKQEIKTFVNNDNERVFKMATDVQGQVSTTMKDGFKVIKDDINGIDNKYLEDIKNLTTKTYSECKETISNHAAGFQADAAKLETDLLQLASKHQTEYESNANNLNQKLASKLDETDSIITNRLETTNNDSAETFREAEGETLKTSQLLRGVWKETTDILAKGGELTWPLVGVESIKEYIKDILMRTKSTVSIVAPDFSDLPLETIKNASRRIRIIVASRILAESKDQVRELLELGNIQIRQRPEMNLFAVGRDGEEVLIAPYSERSQEDQLTAIVSQQDTLVSLIHEIIGPIWMASSTKITRV